jgi:hypothetical protein
MGTEDVAFSRLATIGPSPGERARNDEIQAGIDATMREVIAGAKYNPNALDAPMVKVTPVGAPVVKDLPGSGPTVSEPYKPLHPPRDWIRLGSRPEEANIEAAEAALAKLEGPAGEGDG